MESSEFDQWIKEHGYSNERLARELGVSRMSIIRWRRGQQLVPQMVALALLAIERRDRDQQAAANNGRL